MTSKHQDSFWGGIVKALGLVFGDIGTSPIYTLTVIFALTPPTRENVFGILSLVFWTMTILVTGDEGIQDLNLEYRGEDSPTDVLSFTALEPDPETGNPYLGDIVISAERAAEQAETAGHPLEAEMQLLVVHGVLHLCGHDHGETEEKARMWAAQAEILGRLGLSGMTISE